MRTTKPNAQVALILPISLLFTFNPRRFANSTRKIP